MSATLRLCASLLVVACSMANAADRPNIVLILADDMGLLKPRLRMETRKLPRGGLVPEWRTEKLAAGFELCNALQTNELKQGAVCTNRIRAAV